MKAILIAAIVAVMPLISSADHHQPATDAAHKADAAAATTEKTVTKTKETSKGAMNHAKDMAHKTKTEAKTTTESVKKDAKDAHHEMTK